MTTLRRMNFWVRKEVCSTPFLALLLVALVFVGPLACTKTPTEPSNPPGPTPTPIVNSVNFVSSDPAPGSTLKVGDPLSVTIAYTIAQASSFNVYPEGTSGSSTGETVMTPGNGTVKIVYTATKPGTSTVLDLNMGWGPGYAYSLTNKVAATYTWVAP